MKKETKKEMIKQKSDTRALQKQVFLKIKKKWMNDRMKERFLTCLKGTQIQVTHPLISE